MKNIILFILVFLVTKPVFAQQSNSSNADSIYNFVLQKPQFPGGDTALTVFLSSRIQYPDSAQKSSIEGTDVARFVVNKDGSISDIEVLRDIGYGCKNEVIRVLQLMPKWIPGQMDEAIVRSYYYLPVAFKLSKVPVDTVYSICDSMPKFPGGEKKMNTFILDNNKYPPKNNENKIFDVIQFVVDTDGSILQPRFLINGYDGSDSEALRIISIMPQWIPARQHNKKVKAFVNITIPFNESATIEKYDSVYVKNDTTFVRPRFPGGQKALMDYLATNARYPPSARENGIQGSVVAQFVVDSTGSISRIICLRDIGGGCFDEVERVIRSMPKWIPGTANGKPLNEYFTLPVAFALASDKYR